MVKKKESSHKYLWVILEAVFVIAILFLGIFGYVYLFSQVNFPFLEDKALIQNSFVGGTLGSITATYSVEWMFSHVLRTLFLFVGNHVEAVIILQFVMQLLAAFIIYRALRYIVGRILSCTLLAAQIAGYLFLSQNTLLNPCWMVLLLSAIIFYFLILIITKIIVKKACKNTMNEIEIMDTVAEAKISEEPMTEETTDELNVIIENKPVIKFLDNPLPGPKKHVSKTLDYDLKDEDLVDVSMEYDIDVSDDDDFDL